MSSSMQDFDFERALHIVVSVLKGPAMLGMLGYIGLTLSKDDPTIKTKKFVGGVIVSGFVGYCTAQILSVNGFDAITSATVAAMLGSQGPAGLQIISTKLKAILSKET